MAVSFSVERRRRIVLLVVTCIVAVASIVHKRNLIVVLMDSESYRGPVGVGVGVDIGEKNAVATVAAAGSEGGVKTFAFVEPFCKSIRFTPFPQTGMGIPVGISFLKDCDAVKPALLPTCGDAEVANAGTSTGSVGDVASDGTKGGRDVVLLTSPSINALGPWWRHVVEEEKHSFFIVGSSISVSCALTPPVFSFTTGFFVLLNGFVVCDAH
jgi:hypothetical protein